MEAQGEWTGSTPINYRRRLEGYVYDFTLADGIVGNAREQAHSLGDIVSRMEKGPSPQAHPAVLQQQGLDPAASALDILPGLAAVLGGLQQQDGS